MFRFIVYAAIIAAALVQGQDPFLECLSREPLESCLLLNGVGMHDQVQSQLQVHEALAEPDNQGWSRCQYCGFDDRKLLLFNSASGTVDLSWSLWSEFFYHTRNDAMQAVSVDHQTSGLILVSRPVFIIQMITFHVGHILVDVLEQIYFTMIRDYGRVRRDALIVIDCANVEERAVLQDKLLLFHESMGNVLLSAVTELPLIAYDSFAAMRSLGRLVFRDIHVGIDVSLAHFHLGFQLQPCLMSLDFGNQQLIDLSVRYRQFSGYLRRFTNHMLQDQSEYERSAEMPRAVFVQRESNGRRLLNLEAAEAACDAISVDHRTVDVSVLDVHDQVRLFDSTDILISAAGTALHNMLLMRPGSAVLIVMQPQWCQWAWMYANQAVLLGIEPFIYCTDESSVDVHPSRDTHSFRQWSHRFWRQGPRLTKLSNITLDIGSFTRLLSAARTHIVSGAPDREPTMICPGAAFEHRASSESESRPLVEIYVSSLTVEAIGVVGSGGDSVQMRRVSVFGEMGLDRHLRADEFLLQSLTHLSLCVAVVRPGESDRPWCHPVYGLNYLSKLQIDVEEGVYLLHLWAQASPEGGRLRGSDLFLPIDCSLPSGGFAAIDAQLTKARVPTPVDLSVVRAMHHCTTAPCAQYPFRAANKVINLADPASNLYSLQLELARECRARAVSNSACALASAEVFRSVALQHMIAEAGLPAIQHFPTAENLFVFLHIEKTGGTTVREFIVEAAERHSLPFFIPCHGGVHCVTLEPPVANEHLRNVSIVAGHFFWDVWKQLPTCRGDGSGAGCQPSCLVMGRHPVERAISYYYQRCYQLETCIGYQRLINSLTAEELEFIVEHERQASYAADNTTIVVLDEGMSNAACRSVAGLKATTGVIYTEGVAIPLPPVLDRAVYRQALENAQQCTVGILERWAESQEVLATWFPWMDFSTDTNRRKMHLYTGKESKEQLRAELREVLVRHNECDMLLYEEMSRRFDEQLRLVRRAGLLYKL